MPNPSPIEILSDRALVTTSQGDRVVIDIDTVPLVEGFAWQTRQRKKIKYAVRRYRDGNIVRSEAMHRRIAGAPADRFVDHIDGDGLNNTKANLRICTPAENAANLRPEIRSASGFSGVYRRRNKYQARICRGQKRVHLGMFDTPEEAHEAYRRARKVAEEFYRDRPVPLPTL